ncbi:hypothetical protein L3067_14035 [Xanthomonas sp. PPL568]|uniref:hypothetical protein n=1 Tax=Xanthomonas indica TaxID=2912242 RepID=UPI001F562754|nr:hypothetical protein [Xanthomonas indica]MCI2245724.1 hypothetical protein [Xanthomonas indica]
MYETHPFDHNGKKYEVRSASDGCTIRVRAFLDGKPANGYTYQVEISTQIDAVMSGSAVNPARDLIEIAISDVKRGIWEQYLAAVAATGDGD